VSVNVKIIGGKGRTKRTKTRKGMTNSKISKHYKGLIIWFTNKIVFTFIQ